MDSNSSTSSLPPSPKITTSNTPHYQHRLAQISSAAAFTDPLNILFQTERMGTIPTVKDLYDATLTRIQLKTSLGSSIVEADNFAAVACWEPPGCVHPRRTPSELEELAKTRPVYASFVGGIERVREECLGEGQRCWQLALMARNPEQEEGMGEGKKKGVVRGVLEWGLKRAREEGVPVWCVAGNERARDVYGWFGFRVVGVVGSGVGVEGMEDGVESWCMVFN